jgi:predicted nucleic acid-binding protein
VSLFLVLDSGPLSLLTHPQSNPEVLAVTQWLRRCLLNGSQAIVPAIIYYELRRELLRAKKSFGLGRLDAFVNAVPGRYLPLSDEALRLAAELWAQSRQQGQPTASPHALDIDVILAAQALSCGVPSSQVVIVTTNVKHLSQFVDARHWDEVVP